MLFTIVLFFVFSASAAPLDYDYHSQAGLRLGSDTIPPTVSSAQINHSLYAGTSVSSNPPEALSVENGVIITSPPDPALNATRPALSITPSSNATTDSAGKPLVMAYYAGWAGERFPPEKIDFSRLDWIDYAFALPDATFNISWADPVNDPQLLARLVRYAHLYGKKVKISVGGWTGSKYFSSAVAGNNSRQNFARNICASFYLYGVDGIDIDWEYPAREGQEGNQVDPQDSANFLLFLKELRVCLPPSAVISAAVSLLPFFDQQGRPMINVTDFANVLDWITLMNYDIWGSSPLPGPNAPLNDACHNSTQPNANAVAGYMAWISAGFPSNQITLGVPAYGYISSSSATALRTRDNAPPVRVVNEDGYSTGQIQFRDLVQQGALTRIVASNNDTASVSNGTMMFLGDGGFTRRWDNCSNTPFLTSRDANQVITYDDGESLRLKAAFARMVGMRGVNMFDVHGDTDGWDLVDALREGMGL